MIDAAALTAMHSAAGSNCYYDEPIIEPGKLKQVYNAFASTYNSLKPRLVYVPPPAPEKQHWCNAAAFAGVQYYGEFASLAQTFGATDYMDARWEFHVASGDNFDCAFVGELIDAMAIMAPEFAIADIRLREAVTINCEGIQELSGNHKREVPTLVFL